MVSAADGLRQPNVDRTRLGRVACRSFPRPGGGLRQEGHDGIRGRGSEDRWGGQVKPEVPPTMPWEGLSEGRRMARFPACAPPVVPPRGGVDGAVAGGSLDQWAPWSVSEVSKG